MRFAELDAVTVDAFGTLVTLVDPVPALDRALRHLGVSRPPDEIAAAFAAEAAYYRPRSLEGRDPNTLADLQRRCAAVFLEALGADVDPAPFAPTYVASLEFEPAHNAKEALEALAARGLALGVVSNWDCTLPRHLETLGLARFFAAVVTSAEAGVAKPDPRIFAAALERLGTAPERTIHVGDGRSDELGAAAAGIHFAPAPLADAVAAWS
jgi:putative hydrolase of the HAD superfamily